MKNIIILLFLVLFTTTIQARIPYGELELHRKQTIVTRVYHDFPGKIKCTNLGTHAGLGQKLHLADKEAQTRWAKAKVSEEDLKRLEIKLRKCVSRASCHSYSIFLSALNFASPKLKELDAITEAGLNRITSKDYLYALVSVKDPCTVF